MSPSAPPSKVTDKLKALGPDQPFYTFEVFPPKTAPGTSNLIDRIARMSSLNPSWVHVTWGAGGSTQERSLDLAGATQELGVDCCLHLTCTNMERSVLDRTLERARELGVVNLLALRGDPPRGEEYWTATDAQFQHATDLVRYIKEKHGDAFCIGVAGYPEGHADSDTKTDDIEYLFQKQEAGAEFVVTQLFYDVGVFIEWYDACRARGITIPILPGIMPIQNYQSFRRMTNLCKTCIPPAITADLERIQHDDAAVKTYGINLAVEIIETLREHGIQGYHLCTLNLEKSVQRVLSQLGWAGTEGSNYVASNGGPPLSKQVEIVRAAAGTSSTSKAGPAPGKDSPTSWDEFPNGRFGDARSPAYGDLDGYGSGLKLPPAEALKQWGYPTTLSDISTLFSSYLAGTVASIPWSEEALRPETISISRSLARLNNDHHWWTVGSQPAVDGASSTHPVHGFGPKGGFVYQKAFVEFFLEKEELEELARRAAEEEEGTFTWFASNKSGELRTNLEKGDVNAVTWGVFPGKEIVTTTLIEEMSFKAWNEEAFEIWQEWSYLYPAGSPSRKLLSGIAESRWLVSVCHHNYKEEEGLWRWLLKD